MNQVEGFKIKPQTRQFAKGINRMARLKMLLNAKKRKMSQEVMMLQELEIMQDQKLKSALQQAPKDLVHELEGQSINGEM